MQSIRHTIQSVTAKVGYFYYSLLRQKAAQYSNTANAMIKECLKIKTEKNNRKEEEKKNSKTVKTMHVKYNDNDNTIKSRSTQ